MNTYFIRHSPALDVDAQTITRMWNEDYAGIHYPHWGQELRAEDCTSLDPEDYSGTGRGSVERLTTIAREGGYLYVTYRGIPGAKLGYVEPGSHIELLRSKWGNRNGLSGREAVLKVLKLTKVINLTATQSLPLSTVQPRQGTICRWKKAGDRVLALVEGMSSTGLNTLSPDLQEVMCMEYLRQSSVATLGLPVLSSTLAPIGRTMKDVDIYGLAHDGKRVIAQVTYHHLHSGQAKSKLRSLDTYADDGAVTVMFCRCARATQADSHLVFPLEDVYQNFCIDSEQGRAWIVAVAE